MPPPPSYALEDGCGEQTNGSEIPQPIVAPTVTTIVVRGNDPESCRIRRRLRMETLRAKRAAKLTGRPARKVAVQISDTATVSSGSTVSTYTLSKDELRRKKNRESAERSRLRKLSLIDFLTKQATALSAKLHRLTVLNRRLRNGEVVGLKCAHSPRSGSCSDCDSTDGDLSTISGSSSPHTLNTSFSRGPTGKHNLRARTTSALSDDSSTGSDRLFADSFPNKRARRQDATTTAVEEAPFPSSSSRHAATLPGGLGKLQGCTGADALESYLCPRSTLAAVASLTALFPGEEGGGLSAWATRLDDGFLLDGLLDFDLSEFPLTGLT